MLHVFRNDIHFARSRRHRAVAPREQEGSIGRVTFMPAECALHLDHHDSGITKWRNRARCRVLGERRPLRCRIDTIFHLLALSDGGGIPGTTGNQTVNPRPNGPAGLLTWFRAGIAIPFSERTTRDCHTVPCHREIAQDRPALR